jgi:pteridine reductase
MMQAPSGEQPGAGPAPSACPAAARAQRSDTKAAAQSRTPAGLGREFSRVYNIRAKLYSVWEIMESENPNASNRGSGVALVTGGAVRVGRAIALELARGGYRVAVHHCRSEEAAASAVAEISASGGSAEALRADLTIPGTPARLVEEAVRRFGRLDLLVNSAAVFGADDAPMVELARMKALNADAPSALVDAAVEHLAAAAGAIVNIADVAGFVPFRGRRAYSMTKRSVLALTARKALELAPRGVRVNAVCPGAVLFPDWYPEALRRRVIDGVPLGRMGSPEDIAQAVAYLARARFVTGQVLSVDGGRLLSLLEGGAEADEDLARPPDGGDLN